MKHLITPMALLGAFALSAPHALAGEEEEAHADAMVLIDPSGKLVTGVVDFDEQTFEGFARVYEAEFELFDLGGGVQSGVTDEPGFNALAAGNATLPAGYSTLTPGTALSFDADSFVIGTTRSNLWHWDGTGAVDFSPAAASIGVSKAGLLNATIDGSDSDIDGFEIAVADLDGGVHQHLDLELPDAQLAPTGFYLFSFTLSTSDGKVADEIYFVHGLGIEDEEAHEAAVDWVALNVAPAPGAALTMVAGLGLLSRRRR